MSFQQVQHAFIAHIKDPACHPVPAGISEQRMAVYRELVFNNIQGFVSAAFPVLKSLYSETDWQQLIRQFFIHYPCSSPYFLHIAEHFLHYLQQDYQLQSGEPAFILELAHYEWAELYLATKSLTHEEKLLDVEQVSAGQLQLSELSMLLAYPYPVHQISVEFQPAAPGETQCYLLYRNQQDEVKFILINTVTAALLHSLQQAPGSTLGELVQQLVPMLPQFDHATLQQGAVAILHDFAAKGVLVSFQAGQNSLP